MTFQKNSELSMFLKMATNGLAISSSVLTSLLFSFYSTNLANKPELSSFKPQPKLLLIAIVELNLR
jgi:hypothetical protein